MGAREIGAILKAFLLYPLAAFCEIGGCFAFWSWLKSGRTALWTLPGTVALLLFAALLTRIPSAYAGRAFAAYGGIYVAASLLWLWLVEQSVPDRWDLLGAAVCIAGSAIIVLAPHNLR